MSVQELRASTEYDRPLFHPGQVLSDAELTRLAESARSLLAAETRRHGWGIVQGLLLYAKEDAETITIGRGMVTDQKGQLFELVESAERTVSELLDASSLAAIPGTASEEFDLWLLIGTVQSGPPAAHLTLAREAGYAPMIDEGSKAENRAVRAAVTAELELRPASEFDKWIEDQNEAFEEFKNKFNESDVDINTLRQVRLAAMAGATKPGEFAHVPLGRVTIARKDRAIVVKKVDWAVGRREQLQEGLPVRPGLINSAPLFDLTRNEAVTWLARRGIQPWSIEVLDASRLKSKQQDNPAFLDWRPELTPGATAKLYVSEDEDRVLLAEAGPFIAAEIFKLQRIATLFGIGIWIWIFVTAILLVAIFWK